MDDRYQIIQRTAEHPYGIQYESTDTLINRKAEIHRFAKPGETAPADWEKIFNDQSSVLTTMGHMGLPIIYDRGTDEGGPYLIRQLIEEPTLQSRLKEGPLSEYEAWELAQQLLDIHTIGIDKGFFHGALSPEQICYATRPGGEKRYYISNFGLAELHNRINGTEEYFGDPCLVSLEQADGKAPSEVSEIFSIGQLLYQCLAENHPFAANRVDEMAELHKNYPLAPIRLSREDVPKAMSDWIIRMTAVETQERFSTFVDAMHHLPAPVQTAPVPVIPTHTTTQQTQTVVAGQTTGVQQTAQAASTLTGTQAVGFTTTTQAVTAKNAVAAQKKQSGGGVKALLQEPLILGGIALAVVLLIVGVVVFSGNDDDAKDNKDNTEQAGEGDSEESNDSAGGESGATGLKKGLIVALNFNGSTSAKNDSSIKLKELASEPSFARGLYGQGLVLDKDHYYRLPLADHLPTGDSANFTISFWVKNLDKQEPVFISDEPWTSDKSHKLGGSDGKEMWQWSPDNAFSKKESATRSDWSMVTLAFSRKNDLVIVYNNGELMGSSSTKAIQSLNDEKYLYIGCDSRQKFNFASPTVIDQLYIWDRKLKSSEIRSLYKDDFTY